MCVFPYLSVAHYTKTVIKNNVAKEGRTEQNQHVYIYKVRTDPDPDPDPCF
jgi:hypothetical protein